MQKILQVTPSYNKTMYFFYAGKYTVYFNVTAYEVHGKSMDACKCSKEQLKQDFAKIGRSEAVQIRLQEKKCFTKRRGAK